MWLGESARHALRFGLRLMTEMGRTSVLTLVHYCYWHVAFSASTFGLTLCDGFLWSKQFVAKYR